MAARTRNAKSSVDDRIGTLNRLAAELSPAKKVFTTASTILALVRDKGKRIDNQYSIQLSESCFSVCEGLSTLIRGTNTSSPDECIRVVLEDSERVMREIKRTLRREATTPHTKAMGHMLEITGILLALSSMILGFPHSVQAVDPLTAATTSAFESACGRLVRREFSPHELPSLIEVIFLSSDGGEVIRTLPGDDIQTFIDVIYEVLDAPDLPSATQKRCLKLLYRTCGRHALLPRALKNLIFYDRTHDPLYRGGYADVWKGECCGREVAVKVIRTYSNSDLQKIIGRFCKEVVTWKFLKHPNVLPLQGVTMSENRFAMASDWMVNGNIREFVTARPDVDRLSLLVGVAKGLIYIHSQGMVHGDLKGANILIDQTGNPLLADFGLLTIVSDPSNFISSSSCAQGGTVRWMGPECIAPQEFGLKDSRPTKSSDCYSLGMVIYETISGSPPFHECTDVTVFLKILKGEHPSRGVEFTDGLWEMLERCWMFQPNDRPRIEDVLQYLESVSNGSELPSSENSLIPKEGDSRDSPSIFAPKLSARETTPPQLPTCDSASTLLTPAHPRPSGSTSPPPTPTLTTQPTSQSANDQPSNPGVKHSAEDVFSGITLALDSLVENAFTRSTEADDRKRASSSSLHIHPDVSSAGWPTQDTERTYTTPQNGSYPVDLLSPPPFEHFMQALYGSAGRTLDA